MQTLSNKAFKKFLSRSKPTLNNEFVEILVLDDLDYLKIVYDYNLDVFELFTMDIDLFDKVQDSHLEIAREFITDFLNNN
jgi:hypothetical protein